jgi:hypothetical protein
VLQYLVWWWLSAAGRLGPRNGGSFHPFNFGIEHVSPVAYALFAFAFGAFVGAVSRRTLVAMTTGLAAFIVARFVLSPLVERLAPTQRLEVVPGTGMSVRQDGSLVVASGWLDASGQPVPGDRARALIQSCKSTPQGSGTPESQQAFLACLPKSGLAKEYADFVPESQAWQVHLVDASIYGGLAILLLVGTALVLRRQS